MDPVSATSAANLFAAAFGGSKAAGPSSADSIFGTNLQFDNSGWNVSFGSSKIDSVSDKTSSQGAAAVPSYQGNVANYLPYALIFVGALIAWRMTKK